MRTYIMSFGAIVLGVVIGLWSNDAANVDVAAGILAGAFTALAAHRRIARIIRS